MKKIFLFFLFVLYAFVLEADEIPIEFEYPAIAGDFYVAGTVFFPPLSVPDPDNILVIDKSTEKEVISKITVIEKWPDGSILSAEIVFPASSQRKTRYAILYGDKVRRKKSFTDASVLPTISFVVPGAGKTVESMDVSVGQINVRVDRSASIRYWWYLLPALILIFLTILRTLRTIRIQRK
ncbi:MAG: hypothetical protein N2115_04530 [bacterium]|nr:hypothetical protein [bacterium]